MPSMRREYLNAYAKVASIVVYITLPMMLARSLAMGPAVAVTTLLSAFGVTMTFAAGCLALAACLDGKNDEKGRGQLVWSAIRLIAGAGPLAVACVIHFAWSTMLSSFRHVAWLILIPDLISVIGMLISVWLIIQGFRDALEAIWLLLDSPTSRSAGLATEEPEHQQPGI